MTVPGCANPLLMYGDAGGYQIERSLRFNSSDSASLSRTPAVAGNRTTWTWAGWVKISKQQAYPDQKGLFFAGTSNSNLFRIMFQDVTGQLRIDNDASGSNQTTLLTTQLFRDFSAWMHIALAVDTNQVTASDRFKLYVNGNQVTTFSTATYQAQGTDTLVNSTNAHSIGVLINHSPLYYFDGYLADIHFIDGQALTPSSFTEVSATTGQLVPKAYTGSFGTNGFHLPFSDNSATTATTLGKDTSGNGNNWTVFNLQTTTGGPTSVAAASGALPIYNTTDTYGTTKGSGTRTDSNSSFISLALPMDGTNGGTSFSDQSATIKGSGSAKTVTVVNATTSTSQSKYYGSSGFFNNNGYLSVPYSSDIDLANSDFTVEAFVYKTTSDGDHFVEFRGSGSTGWSLYFQPNNTLQIYDTNAGTQIATSSGTITLNAWTHVALTRNGTGSNNCTFWINGVNAGSFTYTNFAATNSSGLVIARAEGAYNYLTGYLQDLRIYKGVAKYTSNFNPPSSTQNPTIAAGNDSLVDTPTSYGTDTGTGGGVRGNYCTANPLATTTSLTLSNGNLQVVGGLVGGATYRGNSTIGVASGKWYFETTFVSVGDNTAVGIGQSNIIDQYPGQDALSYAYVFEPAVRINSNSQVSYGSALTASDVFMCAFDLDNNKIFFGKNGTWFGSSVPASGTNPAYTLSAGTYTPIFRPQKNSGTCEIQFNFGQRAFAYTAPSGFKALCDTNLPAPIVAKPNTVMDVKLYTGNGSTQTISGLGFSPDLIWIKSRSAAYDHQLGDTVRGVTNILHSNLTAAESTLNTITGTSSDGFTVSAASFIGTNANGQTFAAWTWDAGSSTVSNPDGSITSSVRANASAGFSIVSYTSTGGTATVGHGLGIAPSMVITKGRNVVSAFITQHVSLAANNVLYLNGTDASQDVSGNGSLPKPTSTVFSVNNQTGSNGGTYNMIAYCFAPVTGYSSFGSYTGNGSATDNTFVYTGMRPRFVMLKRSDSTGNWVIWDAVRNSYNVANSIILPNSSAAEYSPDAKIDILSNGFKVRDNSSDSGTNGATYIYYAISETAFQYSRAR